MNSSGASVLPQLRVSSGPQWQPAGEQTFWLLALVSLLLVFLVENAVLVPFTAHINYLGLPPSTCFWWNLKQDESAWLRKDEACRKQRMWSCGGGGEEPGSDPSTVQSPRTHGERVRWSVTCAQSQHWGMLPAYSLSTGEGAENKDPWGSRTSQASIIAETQAPATPSQEKDG